MGLFSKNYVDIKNYQTFLNVKDKYRFNKKYKQREDFKSDEEYYKYISKLERKNRMAKRIIKSIIFIPLSLIAIFFVMILFQMQQTKKEKEEAYIATLNARYNKQIKLSWSKLGYNYVKSGELKGRRQICFDKECREYIYDDYIPTDETTGIFFYVWKFDKLKLTAKEKAVNKKILGINNWIQGDLNKWFSLPPKRRYNHLAVYDPDLQAFLDYLKEYRAVRIKRLKDKIEILKREDTLSYDEKRLLGVFNDREHLYRQVMKSINGLDQAFEKVIYIIENRVKKYNKEEKYRIEHNLPKIENLNYRPSSRT